MYPFFIYQNDEILFLNTLIIKLQATKSKTWLNKAKNFADVGNCSYLCNRNSTSYNL